MTRSTNQGRRLARLGSVLLVTLLLVSAPTTGQTATPSANIEDVAYSGNGTVDVQYPGLFLWHAASHQFTVTVSTPADLDAEVCLVTNATGRELGCEGAVVPANATEPIPVGLGQLSANMTGETELDVVLRRPNSSEPVDRQSLDVVVLRRDGDLDGDGLTSQREVLVGTDPRVPDTDGDGLSDSVEEITYDTSPVNADSDSDGLSDGEEIETYLTDPMKADTDGDGLPDARELELGSNPFSLDSDGDGITDAVEVNTYGTNATAADTDADGLDDGAELTTYRTNPMKSDTDGDGISDVLEVITYETAPGDPDTDDDGLMDGEEVTNYQTEPTTADTDDDGLNDGAEINAYGTNPLNADTDGDGLDDGAEVNRYGTDPMAIDTDGDGTSDRVEVQTGLFPDIRGPVLLAASVVLTLVASMMGFYWANGRVPGQSAVSSLGDRVRAAGRTGEPRRQRHESAAELPGDSPPESNSDPARDVPPTPLSNEDRVLRCLDTHDGQMRQSDIVEETGWSKAKVSRVLSKMEADDKVAKIDIGRENIVTRPEDVPSSANSPFES